MRRKREARNQADFCPPTATWGGRSSLGKTVTLRSSRASGCIEQCPSNSAPSSTTSTGAVMLPLTLAEGRISIRCDAVMSPLTLPAIVTDAARICAVMTALSPIVSASFATISPSTSPSIFAVPSKESLPLIFDPRSRYAPDSGKAGPLARVAGGAGFDESGVEDGATAVEEGVEGACGVTFDCTFGFFSGSLLNNAIEQHSSMR